MYIFLGNDTESWVLRNNGNIYFNNQVKLMTNKEIEEGDIIVKIKKKIINFCFSKQNL